MTSSIARMLNLSRKDLRRIVGLMALAVSASLLSLCLPAVHAQTANPAVAGAAHLRGDISGNWQGTLDAGKSLRLVLVVVKTEKGWSGKFYSIDQGGQAINASGIVSDGTAFKFSVDMIGGSYEGRGSADGNAVVGTWTQGRKTFPLTLVRASKDTAWEIPEPSAPPKLMAADADPSFDVATIKPNDSGKTSMQGLTINGRNFAVRNGSLGDLIAFAYDLQAKQIVNGPDWLDSSRYDIAAVPDLEGMPNANQLRGMMRKLLADRFKLTFHHEKRELSAFVLTAGKGGQKLTANSSGVPLPGMYYAPGPGGLSLILGNASMKDFTSFMQMVVLDRPVVDQTGIAGRYDFKITFTPDDSQFYGHPPKLPEQTTDSAPNLFEAIQQQLGLKLSAEKTPVDVVAIDHVEKPSAN